MPVTCEALISKTSHHSFQALNSNSTTQSYKKRSKRVCKGWLVKAKLHLKSEFIHTALMIKDLSQ